MALKAFTMPKWGIEMTEGLIASWGVAEGADFARGAVLAMVETDKITNEIEAEADGRFARIVAREGETHPVGALLAVFGGSDAGAAEIDAFIAAFRPAGAAAEVAAARGPEPEPPAPASAPAPVPVIADSTRISPVARARALATGVDVSAIVGLGRGRRISLQDIEQTARAATPPALHGSYPLIAETSAFASPAARRLAADHGVDLTAVAATGPRGRISKADVLAAVPAVAPPLATPPAAVEIRPMSPMRKAIARRLSLAKATIPHFYVRRRVRADRLVAWRAALPAPRPSLNDCLVRAAALALIEVPELNIQVHGDAIHRFATADIAVAVATPRGLVTPVIAAADRLSVTEIAAAIGALAQRARSGQLQPHEYEGGSFTLSNLGGFGVEAFDAIINPPHGAILAVGAARAEPIADDGAVRIAEVIHLSLSCDHRAIDGADAGRFLAALAELIEHPARLG